MPMVLFYVCGNSVSLTECQLSNVNENVDSDENIKYYFLGNSDVTNIFKEFNINGDPNTYVKVIRHILDELMLFEKQKMFLLPSVII